MLSGREALFVNFTQRADQGVPVLMANLAVVIAVAIVEIWHVLLP